MPQKKEQDAARMLRDVYQSGGVEPPVFIQNTIRGSVLHDSPVVIGSNISRQETSKRKRKNPRYGSPALRRWFVVLLIC